MAADNQKISYSYRHDTAVPAFPDDKPLFVFDGVCVLCSGTVGWLLRNDKKDLFRFASAQSPLGQALYAHYGLDMDKTFLLIDEGCAYGKSEAYVRILRRLSGLWNVAALMRFIPRGLRDLVYDVVASHRYRWFGKTEYCALIPESVKRKLLA